MKKIIAVTKREDLIKITPILEDTIYFTKKEKQLVRITIYIPDDRLDDLIENLQSKIDLRYKESIIEVCSPDFVISTVEEKRKKTKKKTPIEKLIESTRPYLELDIGKIALTSVAGMVALTGLFTDNVAIIIGAMLLAPLLGPIYAFTINTAVGKTKNAAKSIANLFILLGMVMLFSVLTTLVISQFMELSLTSEILVRMDSNPIYTFMALFLGFASIFALSKEIPESIAGVAIAAALLPPAVVTGISVILYPSEAVNPLLLSLENVLGLMAGSLIATLFLDIRPRRYYKKTAARRIILRTSLIVTAILIVLWVFSFFL
jgi:uncharacterized hydrophobic protein (TIGR00341 family)